MEGSINILTLTDLSKLGVFLIVNFFTCSPTFAGRQLGRVGLYGLLSYNVTDIFEGLRQNFLVLHYHLLVFETVRLHLILGGAPPSCLWAGSGEGT